jgi:solute carrier family 24 (sodium/potassium/calcium exchanger), member 6
MPHSAVMASFSLVGALEFREFVTSMTPHAAGTQLNAFDPSPLPFASGYYRTRSRGRTPASRGHSGEQDPWDYTLGRSLQLEQRAHSPVPDRLTQSLVVSPSELLAVSSAHIHESPAPVESGINGPGHSMPQLPPPGPYHKVFYALRRSWEILFPTLRDFRAKSTLTKLASLFAAPAVLALTLTLPVVVTPYHDVLVPEQALDGHTPGPLINIEDEEEGLERAVLAEEEVLEEMHDHLKFHKWLMAGQCILGPLFVEKILFGQRTS